MSSSSDERPDDQRAGEAIVVSACLLGVACNHRGRSSLSSEVVELGARHRLIPICPEMAGGLTTPRDAAERQPDGRVTTGRGGDVSDAYRRGAEHAVRVAVAAGAHRAVLKARSPSCGSGEIYDGSFSRTTIAGQGLTAEALRAAGVDVISEEELGEADTLGQLQGA